MKETSKIIIQVESEFHKMLKMKALEKDMTLKELIIKAVKEFLEKDLKNEKENN
jgi:predicted HicB family RNase H-like nuclease